MRQKPRKQSTSGRLTLAPAEPRVFQGLVVKNAGSRYMVLPDAANGGEAANGDALKPSPAPLTQADVEAQAIACHIKGNFRLKGIRTTNPVAVGDRVTVSVAPDGSAYITAIAPRRNYIIRRASNLSKEASILAANIDQALLIITLRHPDTSTTFIDRFLATAEAYRVPVVIVVNKTDLLTDTEDAELLDAFANLYNSIGYPLMGVSAETGCGMEELFKEMEGKISLLAGNSGVGKSTLINHLIPGLDVKTGEISDIHDTGMHTTTFSEMFPLPSPRGGWIIDTPGVRGFGTLEMDVHEVSHFFPEIFKVSKGCKYGDCTHTHEPQCAVLQALDSHLISASRYASYLSILQDADPDKYRKPF